jgi:hypothetical protein
VLDAAWLLVITGQARSIFPFTAVIGQEEMKLALILNVIDPKIGGVMIMGDRGTGRPPNCEIFEMLSNTASSWPMYCIVGLHGGSYLKVTITVGLQGVHVIGIRNGCVPRGLHC